MKRKIIILIVVLLMTFPLVVPASAATGLMQSTGAGSTVTGEGNLPGPVISKTTIFEYTQLPYLVLAVSGDTLYAQCMKTGDIYSSADGGRTWIGPLAGGIPICRGGVVTDSGKVVLFALNGDVYYSNDQGVTFTRTLDESWNPLVGGFDCNGETVMFAQYGVVSPATYKLYRSADGGKTWTAVISKNTSEIRHWHTVKYIRELKTWIVTSGDGDTETFWSKSTNDGLEWTRIATGSPRFRTVGFAVITWKTAVWGCDSSPNSVIYAANLDDMAGSLKRIGTLPGHCMGVGGSKNLLIASARIEEADPKGSKLSWTYASPDAGATWYQEFSMPGSYYGILGPDAKHRFYLQYNVDGLYTTVRAEPRQGISVPLKPVSESSSWHPYEKTMVSLNAADISGTLPCWSKSLYETVFDPVLVLKSSLDKEVVIRASGGNEWLTNGMDSSYGYAIAAGKDALINNESWSLLKGPLPKGTVLGVVVPEAPSTGTVTLTLYGRVLRYDDHRLISVK